MNNIHSDCENYNANKDMCLKWFEFNVSKLHFQMKIYKENGVINIKCAIVNDLLIALNGTLIA